MPWGTFTPQHIISLIAAVLMGVVLYFILKKCPRHVQTIVLGVLSFSGIAAIIYNLVTWNSPLEYLPFHLCSLGAMVMPFAVFTRSKVLGNLLLLWSLGSFIAVVLNYAVAAADVFSPVFNFFYFPHVIECLIPILLFALGHVKLDARCMLSTTLITLGVYTAIHPINLAINAHCISNNIVDWAGNVIQVNYMYSIHPDAGNPLLELLWSILPAQYWYMYLCVVILLVYLGTIYGIHYLVTRRKKSK